jgi:chromosome segregation ATPase
MTIADETILTRLGNRMLALEDEMTGEKAVTRHVLRQASLNADDLATLKTEVRHLTEQMVVANAVLNNHGVRLNVLTQDTTMIRQEITALRTDVGTLQEQVSGLQQDMGEVRQGLGEVRQEMGEIRQEMGEMRQEMGEIRQEMHGMRDDIAAIRAAVAPRPAT